jgi:hypothetical protein
MQWRHADGRQIGARRRQRVDAKKFHEHQANHAGQLTIYWQSVHACLGSNVNNGIFGVRKFFNRMIFARAISGVFIGKICRRLRKMWKNRP